MKTLPSPKMTTLTIILILLSTEAFAQTSKSEDELRTDAYMLGYKDGWAAAYDKFQSNPVPPIGYSGSVGSTTTKFELPNSFFTPPSNKVDEAIPIPENWYVAPSTSGEAVLARANKDGTILPYITTSNGKIEFLDADQAPVWAMTPEIQTFLKGLPKNESGMTFIPVQPAPSSQ